MIIDNITRLTVAWKVRATAFHSRDNGVALTVAKDCGIEQSDDDSTAWTFKPSHQCRLCRRRRVFTGLGPLQALKHAMSVPHLAETFGVSPVEAARVIRGVQLMDGIDPDANKPRRKRRTRWNKKRTVEQQIKRCEEQVEKYTKRIEADTAKLRLWQRRMKKITKETTST